MELDSFYFNNTPDFITVDGIEYSYAYDAQDERFWVADANDQMMAVGQNYTCFESWDVLYRDGDDESTTMLPHDITINPVDDHPETVREAVEWVIGALLHQ